MIGNRLDARKERLAWIAVGLGTFGLGLIATFPYDALQTRLASELNRATGITVRAEEWSVAWPMGIEWRRVSLSLPEWDPIELALLKANVGLVQALGGTLALDVSARSDAASPVTGAARVSLSASSLAAQGPWSARGRLQRVDLSRLFGRYVSRGVIDGEFAYRVESTHPVSQQIAGEGTWKADATDVAIDRIPLGNGRTLSLTFTKISVGVECREGVCRVTTLSGEGVDGSFTGEGTLTIQNPIRNSRLTLTVTLVPGTGFAAKAPALGLPPLPVGSPITVKIIGPLAQPRIAL
ncbi:MAG: type II secretion system protein GspN [Nitrospira sp.]|nr:type II secretion system protein GspN [Nitrospira sp.]MCP9475953.1 type II secretion system protein GspN [Nitrospira sp.]